MSWNKRRLSEGEVSGDGEKTRFSDIYGSASSAIKHGILENMSFCLFRKKAVSESKRKKVINKANIFMEQDDR